MFEVVVGCAPFRNIPVAKERKQNNICPQVLDCIDLSMSSASGEEKSKKQRDVEEYLSKIKLREVFQVKLMVFDIQCTQ